MTKVLFAFALGSQSLGDTTRNSAAKASGVVCCQPLVLKGRAEQCYRLISYHPVEKLLPGGKSDIQPQATKSQTYDRP